MLAQLRRGILSFAVVILALCLMMSLSLKLVYAFSKTKVRNWKRKIRFRRSLMDNGIEASKADEIVDGLPQPSLPSLILRIWGKSVKDNSD